MLPSLGFQEIVLLAVLALIVVGPKDLPLMLRKLGQWTARLRAMANEFREGFDELARQAELDELRKEVDALRRTGPFSDLQRQAAEVERDFHAPFDPAATAATAASDPPGVADAVAADADGAGAPTSSPGADAALGDPAALESAADAPAEALTAPLVDAPLVDAPRGESGPHAPDVGAEAPVAAPVLMTPSPAGAPR